MPRDRQDNPQPWHQSYKQSFERFLASTDEKAVILERITSDIRKYRPTRFLDIGAGNGELSIPLSREVPEYTAIEANPSFASALRSNGLKVIEGVFPFPLPRKYDYVLASHSTTYIKGYMEEMVLGAWDAVAPEGQLTVISLARQEDEDWKRLMNQTGLHYGLRHPDGHRRMMVLMRGLAGDVKLEKITTHVSNENINEMIEALSFIGSNAVESSWRMFMERFDQIGDILEADYKSEKGYRFPIEHYFYRAQKIPNRRFF